MLNFFYGILAGVSLKVSIVLIDYTANAVGVKKWVTQLLNNSAGINIMEDYLGLIIIGLSIATSLLYIRLTPSYLKASSQRRIPNRLMSLYIAWTIINLLTPVSQSKTTAGSSVYEPSLLWILNLFYPDTIGHIAGFPINFLALMCLILYTIYAIMLGGKRKSINSIFHVTAALTFVILSYNGPAAFYLFWLIQSISLLIQAKKLGTITEPKD